MVKKRNADLFFSFDYFLVVLLLGREKYLIKWITMDETCNTRKRREDEKTICDAEF